MRQVLGIISLLLLPISAMAASAPNPSTIEMNIDILTSITQMVAVIMGIGMILTGIFKLKQYGEMRSMMSQQHSIGASVAMLMAGVMLLSLPTFLGTFLHSFWGDANPLPFPTSSNQGLNSMIPAIIKFIRLFGVISFIRGIVLVSKLGQPHSAQPGTLGKALTHLMGGLLCVNIQETINLAHSILGFTGA